MNEWWMNKHSWQEMKCLWIKKCCHQWDFSFLVFVTARALPSLVLIAFYVDRLTGQQSALWGPSRSWEMGLLVKEPPALTSSPELWQQQPAINHLQRPSFIFLPVHIQGDALQHGTCTMREVFLPTAVTSLTLKPINSRTANSNSRQPGKWLQKDTLMFWFRKDMFSPNAFGYAISLGWPLLF